MTADYHKLEWQASHGGVTVDCTLDIAIHPADNQVILLTVPGLDGSVDGYQDKYVHIAESVQEQHGAAVVRMSNPFISSFHFESNLRRALAYIEEHAVAICGSDEYELRIMAHSAGASVAGQIAWEYPYITRLLLMNPATKLGLDLIQTGLEAFGGDTVTILFGSKDPSFGNAHVLSSSKAPDKIKMLIVDGADHHFSGAAFPIFLAAPHVHLFDQAVST